MTGNPAKTPKVKSSPKTTSKVWWWDMVGNDKPNSPSCHNIRLWADAWYGEGTGAENEHPHLPVIKYAEREQGPFPKGKALDCLYFGNINQKMVAPHQDLTSII